MQDKRQSNWVESIAAVRKQLVAVVGGTFVDTVGLLGALIPFILVTSLLYGIIFANIIPNYLIRFVASVAGALVIEGFAIASMILDYQVKAYNHTITGNEPFIKYDGGKSKVAYILLVLAIVTLGHIIPAFAAVPEGFVYLTLIPMVLLVWFGYEMFAVGFTLSDRLEVRKQREEDERLAKATETFAKRSETEAVTANLQAQVELEKAKAARFEQEARMKEAEADQAKQTRLTERQRFKAEAGQFALPSSRKAVPATPKKKSWRDHTLSEITAARQDGQEPAITITGKPVEVRYRTWLDVFGYAQFSKGQAMEHVNISNSTFLNDMKALTWNGLVEPIDELQGIYKFIEPALQSQNGNSQG